MIFVGLTQLLCCTSSGNAIEHLLALLVPACLWKAGMEGLCGEAGNSNEPHKPRQQSVPRNGEL